MVFKRWFALLFAMGLLSLVCPSVSHADGIVIPVLPEPGPAPPLRSLAIKYHRVRVDIDERIATTHIDQVFVNELPYEVEGEYIFPLPDGASISAFNMWVDGIKLEAQMLDAEEAREIYEEIVRHRRDPALLEYAGRGAFRARIYPLPPEGERRIEISYTEVLPLEAGLVRYLYPLNTEKFSTRPLEDVSVSVTIRSQEPVRDVYSPRHRLDVVRQGPGTLQVGYEETNVVPDQDFTLYYVLGEESVHAHLLSFKRPGEDGYWLLLLTLAQDSNTDLEPKDVLLVLDTSGSMRGVKIEQAKNAALYVLNHLNPEDRFNIVAFATGTRQYAKRLVPAGDENAADFVKGLEAQGGTNISRALEETLRGAASDRPRIVLFLTDGLPTEGEVRIDQIVQQVADRTSENVRFFCFGVGYDVNTHLLDTLAHQHGGASSYVRPEEDIAYVVRSLYDRVRSPMLSRLEISFQDTMVDDVYPYPLPDLYAGSQVVLVGRYRDGGSADLTVAGFKQGDRETYRVDDLYLMRQGGADFVPQIWATRKVGYLLTQVRLRGASAELIDEIVALSVRHGIVTPYTSFLIDDTQGALLREGRASIAAEQLAHATPAPMVASGLGASGEAAVDKSVAQEALRTADQVPVENVVGVRQIGERAFVLQDGVWTDTRFDASEMDLESVAFAGDRYFQLLDQHPTWARCLALGEQVILVEGGRAYHMGAPDGAAEAWSDELPGDGDAKAWLPLAWEEMLTSVRRWMDLGR